MCQGRRESLPQGHKSDTCACGALAALLGCKEEQSVIKEFRPSFSLLCHRQSHTGLVTIAQNALDIPRSNSSKTLCHSSSSLHLENTAFPQRHPFCPLPAMKTVDLVESSSQVCEGLLSCYRHERTQHQFQCKTCRKEGRKKAARLKTGTTSQQSLWSSLL